MAVEVVLVLLCLASNARGGGGALLLLLVTAAVPPGPSGPEAVAELPKTAAAARTALVTADSDGRAGPSPTAVPLVALSAKVSSVALASPADARRSGSAILLLLSPPPLLLLPPEGIPMLANDMTVVFL